nr:MAG TPA: hypothetical protein [Caudoviricetes sp.]DAR52468.1 MAG TPA: hypothetical protein [Caudoviricetes sp.]
MTNQGSQKESRGSQRRRQPRLALCPAMQSKRAWTLKHKCPK